MGSKRTVNFNVFVVWRSEQDLDPRQFDQIEDLEVKIISKAPLAYLVRPTTVNLTAVDIKHRLHQIFGNRAHILNALEDDQGHLFIPTGNFNVILTEKLPRKQLEDWARGNRLRILSQSKWRPQSVTLATEQKSTAELNRMLNDLRSDPQVEVAEHEVLTQFKRE